jgi:predicted SAM-dependent methyltransferase
MINRRLKALYYLLLGGPMWLNALLYRLLRAPTSGISRVHLGPGRKNYLQGWINVDANLVTGKLDVWANIAHGVPFRSGTVDAFYSHHVIEHLADAYLPTHFAELYRCLKPGGVVRIGVPNADSAARAFIAGDHAWFFDFPVAHASIGGRLTNFLLCKGEHLSILSFSYMQELLTAAGFTDIQQCAPASATFYPRMIDPGLLATEYESHPTLPHTLIVEARKPGAATAAAA